MFITILLQSYTSINEQAMKSGNEIYRHALIRNFLIVPVCFFIFYILLKLFKEKENEE